MAWKVPLSPTCLTAEHGPRLGRCRHHGKAQFGYKLGYMRLQGGLSLNGQPSSIPCYCWQFGGDPGGTRTHNPLIKS